MNGQLNPNQILKSISDNNILQLRKSYNKVKKVLENYENDYHLIEEGYPHLYELFKSEKKMLHLSTYIQSDIEDE